jgi:hypothetical protein
VKSLIASFYSALRDDRGSRDGRRASVDGAMMYGPGRALQDKSSKTDERGSCNNVSGL